jgi:hypothetical protein
VLRRFAAAVLIVLVLLPFTSPFSTCDFPDRRSNQPAHGNLPAASLADPLAVRGVSFVSSIGRPRLAAISGHEQACRTVANPGEATNTPGQLRRLVPASPDSTILRI